MLSDECWDFSPSILQKTSLTNFKTALKEFLFAGIEDIR